MATITISESAKIKLTEYLYVKPDSTYIRVAVVPNGCSGFKYKVSFDENMNNDDELIVTDNIKILIDKFSRLYLQDAVMEWTEEKLSSGFTFNNPNVTGMCGCGSSFKVYTSPDCTTLS